MVRQAIMMAFINDLGPVLQQAKVNVGFGAVGPECWSSASSSTAAIGPIALVQEWPAAGSKKLSWLSVKVVLCKCTLDESLA